jgi:hypothetical protein
MQKDLCYKCKWFAGLDVCFAYPDGIPDRIYTGDNNHTERQPDQTGDFVFTAQDLTTTENLIDPGRFPAQGSL